VSRWQQAEHSVENEFHCILYQRYSTEDQVNLGRYSDLLTGRTSEEFRFDYRQQQVILLSTVSKPVLGPTQPSLKEISAIISQG
jgi:hypothetical protein